MKNRVLAAVAAAILSTAAAAPASALTLDLAGNFGNSKFFQYGTVVGGVFTPFSASNCSDIGVAGLCYRGSDKYQVEFQHSSGNLLIHPGPNDGQNTMLMFIAPFSANYTFSTTLTRGDSGDGVNVYTFGAGGLTQVGAVNGANPTLTYGGTQFFTKGQMVGIGIDRGGIGSNYYNDSTLLSGSIAGVPEPATWAMLIMGFGFVAYALRRRVRASEVRFTDHVRAIAAA